VLAVASHLAVVGLVVAVSKLDLRRDRCGMFQGRDFGREVASPSLGGRPAIVNCMAQAP
jgi:hypothetical protein